MSIGRSLRGLYRRLPLIREVAELRRSVAELRSESRGAQILRLLDFEIREHPRYSDPRRLLKHAFQVCSQNGEDGMIREIFRRIQPTNRVFAEIGVGDGAENNTAFLLSLGWKGFWIDGDCAFAEKVASRGDLPQAALRTSVSYVTRENIAGLFQRLQVPVELDLLSIDVDQNTYHLWEGLKDYRPRVVVVEYNASLPADIDWKVHYVPDRGWDGTHNFGASLKAFELLGRNYGYSLVGCDITGINAFFVRSDLAGGGNFSEPFTAENHFEPARYHLSYRRGHRPGILDRVPDTIVNQPVT